MRHYYSRINAAHLCNAPKSAIFSRNADFCSFFEVEGQCRTIAHPICMTLLSVATNFASFVTDDASSTPQNPANASDTDEVLPLYFDFSTFFTNLMQNGSPIPNPSSKKGRLLSTATAPPHFTTQRKPMQRTYRQQAGCRRTQRARRPPYGRFVPQLLQKAPVLCAPQLQSQPSAVGLG